MKAVILAAGVGSRIRSLSGDSPKCLLKFFGRTILDYQLDALARYGVEDVTIVVGYRGHEIVEHVRRRSQGEEPGAHFVGNEAFATTGNMYSLSRARHRLEGEEFVCLNADLLCHPELVGAVLEPGRDAVVAVDWEFREETTKVRIEGDRVVELSKRLSPEEASGTFANIASFSARGSRTLFGEAQRLLDVGDCQHSFDNVLNGLIGRGMTAGFVETDGLAWAEIDDNADYNFAQQRVAPALVEAFDDRRRLDVA